jgi:predicted nucleotidyltransferase
VAAISRLGRQLTEVTAALQRVGARYALIGGLALASYQVIRATQDVDLLTELEKADEIDAELLRLGYRCMHRTGDAGNYLRGDERVDLLYAHRPIARGLLERAKEIQTSLGQLRVVSTEGLIGFKLQGLVNDPRRRQDLEDIRALLRANRARLDMDEVREYFHLFNRDDLLDELLDDTG